MNLSELKSLVEIEKKKARLVLCEQAIPREKTRALIKDFWQQFKTAVENPGKRVDFHGGTFEDAMKNKKIWMSRVLPVEAGTDVHRTLRGVRLTLIPRSGAGGKRAKSARYGVSSAGGATVPGGLAKRRGKTPADLYVPEVELRHDKGLMDVEIYYDPEKIKKPSDFRKYYNNVYREIQRVVAHEAVHFGQFGDLDTGWKKTKFKDLPLGQQRVIKNYVEYSRASKSLEKMTRARRAGRGLTRGEIEQVYKLFPDPEEWKVLEKENWQDNLNRSKIQMYLMDPGEVDAHVRGYNYLAQKSKGRITLEQLIDNRIDQFRCRGTKGLANLVPGRMSWWNCLSDQQAKDVKKRWMEHAEKYVPCGRRVNGTLINQKACGNKDPKKKPKTKYTNKQRKRIWKLGQGMIDQVDYETKQLDAQKRRAFQKGLQRAGIGLNVLGGGLFVKQIHDIVTHETMPLRHQEQALEQIAWDVGKEIAITTTICKVGGPKGCFIYGVYATAEFLWALAAPPDLPSPWSQVGSLLTDPFREGFFARVFKDTVGLLSPQEVAAFDYDDYGGMGDAARAEDAAAAQDCEDYHRNDIYYDGAGCVYLGARDEPSCEGVGGTWVDSNYNNNMRGKCRIDGHSKTEGLPALKCPDGYISGERLKSAVSPEFDENRCYKCTDELADWVDNKVSGGGLSHDIRKGCPGGDKEEDY